MKRALSPPNEGSLSSASIAAMSCSGFTLSSLSSAFSEFERANPSLSLPLASSLISAPLGRQCAIFIRISVAVLLAKSSIRSIGAMSMSCFSFSISVPAVKMADSALSTPDEASIFFAPVSPLADSRNGVPTAPRTAPVSNPLPNEPAALPTLTSFCARRSSTTLFIAS